MKQASFFAKIGLGIFIIAVIGSYFALQGNRPLSAQTIDNNGKAHLGYGFNLSGWDTKRLQSMGFNWAKVFSAPSRRLSVNVLIRIDANASTRNNLDGFAGSMRNLAINHGEFVEAYEIGNEVNLDASYGWAAAPRAEEYVEVLCTAYREIKAHDPDSVVVSAGLAPTGRVQGNWEGRVGNNGLYQDEREYFKEFIAAGGGECADAIGYHPYGFSADFDADPDVWSSDPTENCVNGFCFRGVEKIYDIMAENGLGDMQIWATEYGWISRPPSHCMNDASWQGRAWQIVSEQQQADNLAGSFLYADEHMPWMGPMIVFNMDFNIAPWYHECEQMRYYGVVNKAAETALRNIPKHLEDYDAKLVAPESVGFLLLPEEMPLNDTVTLVLKNTGNLDLTYAATVRMGNLPISLLSGESGTIEAGEEANLLVSVNSEAKSVAAFESVVEIVSSPENEFSVAEIPIRLTIVEEKYQVFLPAIVGK